MFSLPLVTLRPRHPLRFGRKCAASFFPHVIAIFHHHLVAADSATTSSSQETNKQTNKNPLSIYKVPCNSASYRAWWKAWFSLDQRNAYLGLQSWVLSGFLQTDFEANAIGLWSKANCSSSQVATPCPFTIAKVKRGNNVLYIGGWCPLPTHREQYMGSLSCIVQRQGPCFYIFEEQQIVVETHTHTYTYQEN